MPTVPQQVEADQLAEELYNAADNKQINNARKRSARLEKERLEVVEALMQHKKTRAYIYNFLEKCDIFGNPLTVGDTHATYFRLGMQNAGKILLQDVTQFPELYVLMMGEARNRK